MRSNQAVGNTTDQRRRPGRTYNSRKGFISEGDKRGVKSLREVKGEGSDRRSRQQSAGFLSLIGEGVEKKESRRRRKNRKDENRKHRGCVGEVEVGHPGRTLKI